MKETKYRQEEAAFWAHYGVKPQERWLQLVKPNTKVRVLEVGEGEPLLFVHGGPGAASIFAPIASYLQEYRCILLDRPGCGLSPAISYTGESLDKTMADLIASCMDALRLETTSIAASSFGGACAMWFSRKYAGRVSRLVQLGCPAFVSAMQTPLMMRLLATPLIGYALARAPMTPGGVKSFMKMMGQDNAIATDKVPDAFVNWWISLVMDTDTMRNERELIRCGLTLRGMRPELVVADRVIQASKYPTYFYWGVDDPFAPASFGAALVKGMKHGKIDLIADSGHLPWFDDPEDAARRVQAFLKQAISWKGRTASM